MSNSYRYVDPDYTYIDPKSGVLKNLAAITDSEDLLFFESNLYINGLKIINQKLLA